MCFFFWWSGGNQDLVGQVAGVESGAVVRLEYPQPARGSRVHGCVLQQLLLFRHIINYEGAITPFSSLVLISSTTGVIALQPLFVC